MSVSLSQSQIRVIGCLLEKEVTTPEHYPLSINALTNACNQKSNRDPVLSLSEVEVQQIVDELSELNLVTSAYGAGSRVAKYQHRFCNTEFGQLKLSEQQKAIICVLFLRGAQTPGELRTRTQRMCDFSSVVEVEQVLKSMAQYDHPLVQQLPREPGKREARWGHLFGECPESSSQQPVDASNNSASLNDRVAELELQVKELQAIVAELKQNS